MSGALIDEWEIEASDNNAMKYLLSNFPLSKIDTFSYYFQIQGENELGFLTGYILVNEVMDLMYPQKNIDWQTIPNHYLTDFFSQKYKEINFPFSKSAMQLTVDSICKGSEVEKSYPSITSNVGTVFVSEIKGKYQWQPLSNNNIGVKVYCYLGSSAISLSLLKSVSIGDVLLVDNLEFFLFIDNKKWVNFSWNGENSVTVINDEREKDQASLEKENIENNIETNLLEKSDNNASDDEKTLCLNNIGAISLSVSFLLASKVLPVEQISELSPGQKIELPANAYRHIQLNVNGITIAQGELIKVGDRFAVEIQRTYTQQE